MWCLCDNFSSPTHDRYPCATFLQSLYECFSTVSRQYFHRNWLVRADLFAIPGLANPLDTVQLPYSLGFSFQLLTPRPHWLLDSCLLVISIDKEGPVSSSSSSQFPYSFWPGILASPHLKQKFWSLQKSGVCRPLGGVRSMDRFQGSMSNRDIVERNQG